MARRVFYSFHYEPDCWRASKIRNIGAIEGNKPATDNGWESVTKGGDASIESWISEQMNGRTCTVVLIGNGTAGRKWIKHEIIESWKQRLGLVGIHIHNITDRGNQRAIKGANPFAEFNLNGKPFSSIVKTYDPPFVLSNEAYGYIATNLESWIDEAIKIRAGY